MLVISLLLIIGLIVLDLAFNKDKKLIKVSQKQALDFDVAREIVFRNRENNVSDNDTFRELKSKFKGNRLLAKFIQETPLKENIEKNETNINILSGLMCILTIWKFYELFLLFQNYSDNSLGLIFIRICSIILYSAIAFYIYKVQIEGYLLGLWVSIITLISILYYPTQNPFTTIEGIIIIVFIIYLFLVKNSIFDGTIKRLKTDVNGDYVF